MLCKTVLKQKASKWTPFVFISALIFVFAFFPAYSVYANDCALKPPYEDVEVDDVFDGDTIRLVDGRKIRLIGINTPERDHDEEKNEPFYQEAKNKLQEIIRQNNNKVKLVLGEQKQDRYKRFLAHIFTLANENITKTLLQHGLGFTIAIPPNIKFLKCYQKAEHTASTLKRGIWSHQYSHAIDVNVLAKSARGFHRLSGRVKRIGESRSSIWLNLATTDNKKVALRIPKKDLPYFTELEPKDLLNQRIIARGWIYKVKSEQRINIHHPASLSLQKTD